MTKALNYNLRLKQASIIVELFLPKKARFQGQLHDTLSEGLDIGRVRAHFGNPTRVAEISSTLVMPHLKAVVEDKERMSNFPQVFFGYSLYEVDGVYVKKNGPPAEESTQVVRMLFEPDAGTLFHDLHMESYHAEQIMRAYQRARHVSEQSVDPADFDVVKDVVDFKDIEEAVNRLRKWYMNVEVFVFGFVVFRLCEKIKELQGTIKGWKAEEEIWVTTTDATLQRVVLKNGESPGVSQLQCPKCGHKLEEL